MIPVVLITVAVIASETWIWIGALIVLAISGVAFLNHLLRHGVDRGSTPGSSRLAGSFSELQTLVDPGHRHVIEERERERGEHDDSGDDPHQDQ